jgi:hypothetical protein
MSRSPAVAADVWSSAILAISPLTIAPPSARRSTHLDADRNTVDSVEVVYHGRLATQDRLGAHGVLCVLRVDDPYSAIDLLDARYLGAAA